MKKLAVMAVIAVAMVSMSSAFAGNGNANVADEPLTNDSVVAPCQSSCPDSAQIVVADSVQ